MTALWKERTTSGFNTWAGTAADVGEINGSADVLSSVERDLTLLWMVNGSVETDLNLLWQLNVSAATSVESDLHLSWNLITTASTSFDIDLELLWQRAGSVVSDLDLYWQVGQVVDVAGAGEVRRPIKHPGWSRKQAADVLARERAMERSIRVALNGEDEVPPALKVEKPPQRTAAQMAAEMAAAQAARAARQRAVELGMEAQRARVEIERLQPELAARRQQASYRVIESLLRQM